MASDPTPPGAGSGRAGGVPGASGVGMKYPGRGAVWVTRGWIMLVVGFVAFVVAALTLTAFTSRAALPIILGQVAVIAVTVLFTVPMAVLAWQSSSRPYPDTNTMHNLTHSLGKVERKSADRALRRGRDIAPSHQAYAVAKSAVTRRELIFGSLTPALFWAQVVLTADDELGSAFSWTKIVLAIGASIVITGVLLVQRRAERSLRALVR